MKKSLVLGLTLLLFGFAQSEPTQDQKAKKETRQDQRGTEKQPLVIKGIPSIKTDAEAGEEREHRERQVSIGSRVSDALKGIEKESERTTILTGLLFVVALLQACFFVWQLLMIRASAADTKTLALAAQSSADAAKTQAEALMASERAYVRMSHMPPGLHIEPDGYAWVVQQLKNVGRTPARITDVILNTMTSANQSPQKVPSYEINPNREIKQGFLAQGEEIFGTSNLIKWDSEMLRQIASGAKHVWLLGYVDYIDHFRGHHRAGYARLYNPDLDNKAFYNGNEKEFAERNNLVFVTQPGYNYDRPREKGEGDDWDEEAPS